LLAVAFLAGSGLAQDEAGDITEDVLTGPGSVSVTTKKGIQMSFGAQVRMIPTVESDWDFGMSDEVDGYITNPSTGQTNFNNSLLKGHLNESGLVNNNYIRTESRVYFNALPQDRKWSFYAALEYDRPIENESVDDRGGPESESNFGLERLHGTIELPMNMRFHAGWDVWGVDIIDAGGLVYGDDNPGFWLTGDYGALSFNVGYFKLEENNFQTKSSFEDSGLDLEDETNADRDIYAGYLTYDINKEHKFQPFYVYDRIRSIPVRDFLARLSADNFGISTGEKAETDSHHVGAYYTGQAGMLEYFLEGVYQFGSADDTGLNDAINPYTQQPYANHNDYDIAAYAVAGDLALQLKDFVGFSLKPHIGGLYTSGDDDPNDDELNGYTGVENAQRFSQYWGGENTIVGDTNFVFGSLLYGYLPELYGNGTPVSIGGLQNAAGFGGGRGDNPGLSMTSLGLSATPKKFIIIRTNVNSFWWNEDFVVQDFVNPISIVGVAPDGTPIPQENKTTVDSGYVGTEWDTELTLAFSQNTFVKGQVAFFFPGDGIEDATEALGAKSDDVASRIAAEIIWKF
jgi:hypothetical protein